MNSLNLFLNIAHSLCRLAIVCHSHILPSTYISPLPPPHFYRPIPYHLHSNAPDAQNVSVYRGRNSTAAEEVSRFQCLFPNPSWLVWKGIPPPKTRNSLQYSWVGNWLMAIFPLEVELNLVKCNQLFGRLPWANVRP